MNIYRFSYILGMIVMLSSFCFAGVASAESFVAKNSLKLNSKTFVSDVYKVDEFTGLIYEFDVEMSGDDLIDGTVRFLDLDGMWSEWILLTENNDFRDHGHQVYDSFENIVNTNSSIGFQFKFDIRSGGDMVLPKVELVDYETLNFGNGPEQLVDNVRVVSSLTGIEDDFRVISREAWGADDSLNYTDEYEDEDWEAIEEFEENPYIDRVVTEKDGELLKWPLQYTNDVKFLAVHHTATSADLDNPRQAVRNIQYYHAVRRGWGDIGYNYVIDQQGNIYEGRDGGTDVIGGHSREINKVSVGISLLGNYQEKDVPEAALKSLAKLLNSLADQYNLDVKDYDQYEGRSYPVLGGHSDYSATSCPGIYGKSFLPILRDMVDSSDKNGDFEVTELSSLTAWVDSGYSMASDLEPVLKNVSGKKWFKNDTYLKVSAENNEVIGRSVANFKLKSDTLTGQKAVFEGEIYGKSEAGLHDLKAELYINGVKSINSEELSLSAYVKPIIVEPIQKNDDVPEGSKDDAPSISNPFYSFYLNKNSSSNSNSSDKEVVSSSGSSSGLDYQNVFSNSAVQLDDPRIRVHISKFDKKSTGIKSTTDMSILVDGRKVKSEVDDEIFVWKNSSSNNLQIGVGTDRWSGGTVRIIPEGDVDESVLEVSDYENRPSWNTELNDNRFRGIVEFQILGDEMILINELGIESYMLGLAEVPDSEHIEKAKTIVVAARSYAYYYSNGHGKGLKYKGKPYHLNDSPDSSQKYLGYGFEERSSLNKKAVLETTGETITWFGYDVVIPYFSESDGRTRTATEVWGWSRFKAPYLTSVDDSYCKGGNGKLYGHGVGISGCGASAMAERGFGYDEIINYYLKGVKIAQKY
jgi:hypothetical protein